jgi:hypothetical protein
MAKERHPLADLAAYLPENTFDDVVGYLQKYSVHLTIARQRASVLGDYRNAHHEQNHRISVNGNLNKYAFLITLLHELAHLLVFERYKNRVAPHGKEWKDIYAQLLFTFLQKNIFPYDITVALRSSLRNPSASTSAEQALTRVLRKYDLPRPNAITVEQLKINDYFITADKKIFQRKEKRRTRYLCIEVSTQKPYLISGLYEVRKVELPLSKNPTLISPINI